ncbi:MAG: hypothetical protein R6X15_08850 [Pseudomonadota bacterium]
MSEKYFWYGYLEAGEKSSPVLQDHRLDTGSPETVYLFNLNRGAILEYKRAIIESKLRRLGTHEQELGGLLKSAYIEARSQFSPRGGKATVIPSRGGKPAAAANDEPDINSDEVGGDDIDMAENEWLEEEEA